jgi:hypothetical protein
MLLGMTGADAVVLAAVVSARDGPEVPVQPGQGLPDDITSPRQVVGFVQHQAVVLRGRAQPREKRADCTSVRSTGWSRTC